MNFIAQLDDFWREALVSDEGGPRTQAKYNAFLGRVQAQISHLSQPEQDNLVRELIGRNAEYISIAQQSRDALKVRLAAPAERSTTARLAQVAAETAARATVWQSIASLFRLFR